VGALGCTAGIGVRVAVNASKFSLGYARAA
jgi:hypothetical protein